MRLRTAIAALALLIATSAAASDDAYNFKVEWAHNQFEFTASVGAHWRWLTFGCPKTVEQCKVGINAHGSAGASSGDLLFTHIDDKTLRVECLRDEGCSLSIDGDKKVVKHEEETDIPSGARVGFAVP